MAEAKWFSQFPEDQVKCVKEALWDTSASQLLGSVAGIAVSPHILKTIACERELVDDAIFLATSVCLRVQNILLLHPMAYECSEQPTDDFQRCNLSAIVQQALRRCTQPVQFIVQIVHLPGHWTVAVVNTESGNLFFGNTLTAQYCPPKDLSRRMTTIVKFVEAYTSESRGNVRGMVKCFCKMSSSFFNF